jgi:hypothetical protein
MALSSSKQDKIVVFDVDETLGYFTQLGIFWDALNVYYKNVNNINRDNDFDNIKGENEDISNSHEQSQQQKQQLFNTLIEIFPEVLRVNILAILNYLKRKHQNKKCKHIMIYTNNHGSKDWINLIINYFHEKINYKLFDRIIRAFKINGKIIEACRSTNDKQVGDLFNCTMIPKNSQICFLDDVYFSNMVDENVYYIKLKPYIYILPFQLMLQRFIASKYGKKLTNENKFIYFMNNYINKYNFIYFKKNEKDYELDKIVSKKIMIHLQTFFDKKWHGNDLGESGESGESVINMDNITIKSKTKNKNNHTKKYSLYYHNKTNKKHNTHNTHIY